MYDSIRLIHSVNRILIGSTDPIGFLDILVNEFKLPFVWKTPLKKGKVSIGLYLGKTLVEIYNFSTYNLHLFKKREYNKSRIEGILFNLVFDVSTSCRFAKDRKLDLTGFKIINCKLNKNGYLLFNSTQNKKRSSLKKELKMVVERNIEFGGGILGIKCVEEIVVSSKNLTKEKWGLLNNGIKHEDHVIIPLQEGPCIKLVEGKVDTISSIVIRVNSLRNIKDYLIEKGYLHIIGFNELIADINGIEFKFIN